MKTLKFPQSPPSLYELAEKLRDPLLANYKYSSVCVVPCPDLRQPPFQLATQGLSGDERAGDVGGQPNLFPIPQLDTVWSLIDIAKAMDMDAVKGSLIGAGAGPFRDVGVNCELSPNISWEDGFDSDINNGTRYAGIDRASGEVTVKESPCLDCALMINLFGSRGDPGPVLKVTARGRRGQEKSFTECIRKALYAAYGDSQTISLGGVFLIKTGRTYYHIMPDFPDQGRPFEDFKQLNDWLTYHEFDGPLVCMTVMHSADPGRAMDLRMEHSHGFDPRGRAAGGHYHGDVGGSEDIEYEAYLNTAKATNTNIYNLPIDSLYEVTRLPSLRNGDTPVDRREPFATDFIARGSISNAAAQQLFHRFKPRLDYFCYGIMCPHEDLDALRSSSALLTAAICAVSALHDPEGSGMFKVCHAEFLRLASAGMFSISYSPDDIRGLIVGAYWLANVSYTLIGHAVRVAARLNYHIAYFSVVNNTSIGKERADDIEKARLWYVLYVLDHHSSILYGRPALISATEEPHQQWETFIHANGDNEKDKRITSQVALHHITSKVKEIFGSYSTQGVPEHFLQQLRGYFSELDRWYMAWGNRMQRNPFIGWFPRDGAILHYHFARLHLCSYVFRGMSENSVSAASSNVREYASLAVSSATSVLELVVERDDMRTALAGMPIYFHGMITFAAVFLIKAAKTSFHGLATVDVSKSLSLVQTCMRELRAQSAAPQHLVYHLCNGLEQMMAHSMPTSAEGSAMATPRMTEGTTAGPTTSPEFDVSSSMASIDSMFMANPFDLIQYPADGQAESGMGNGFDWESQFGL
ncbi:hypothetical protein CkaCkLH20_11476 [Colletotrichum karsti]|uniref:Transcription factor domain-containing protein n=1 Tax=Colletotrichum karsti TaxID=1095194 RepID=A0A9P6HVD3_9PEZI|nr:uncharacterized protein CkaCkLH20_11476 [Colletotrichum karsti]KAF9871059.1 hypothetical protein CkaCkLH20_11476 [Colletotrichum karsti]